MNTASLDYVRHLGELRRRLEHATDYEKALHYFLDEFAGDLPFIQASEPEPAPHLVAILGHIARGAFGRAVAVENPHVSHLVAHKFYHGNASVEGRVVLFFCFEEIGLGLMAIIPGLSGPVEVARFRLPGGLVNPTSN
jgi:hypothetical protein